MLRVGLTGELGSGKSTVARLLAAHGALVLSSDDMARAMMQPGEPVYQAIVDHFGSPILLPNGSLNRPELARLAFDPVHPRVEELNAIVHPAVLAEQECRIGEIAQAQPDAIVVVESALLFTTRHAGEQPWRKRFDRIILVTAPDNVKVERFVQRSAGHTQGSREDLTALRADAWRRLSLQRIQNPSAADFCLSNNSGMDDLRRKLDAIWNELEKLNIPTRNAHNQISGKE